MHLLTTHKPPAIQPLATIGLPEQRLHLLRRPRPQTRDVAVKYQTKGNQRDDVGEEEVDGSVPEVIGWMRRGICWRGRWGEGEAGGGKEVGWKWERRRRR